MRPTRALYAGLLGFAIFHLAQLRRHLMVGRAMAARTQRFENRRDGAQVRVLVVGDSSAVGTGADSPAHSVAGRLSAANPGIEIWNLAQNGPRAADLFEPLGALAGTRFDAILVHAGVNDIVRFTPLLALREQIAEVLTLARRLSEHVFLITGGNIGLAPALPPGLHWIVTRRAREVRALFIEAASAAGAVYVDMFDGVIDQPFLANPRRFFARDGFHPNSDGYALWYEAITAAMRKAGVSLEVDGRRP